MRLTQNSKAISRLSLILLLLASAITGALLSYMWVVGYYENLKIRIPEKSDVTITNVTFSPQNTSFFNVTIFNPSYSPSDANITWIAVSTGNGVLHNITDADPPLPFELPRATRDFPGLQTFECKWDWANYTGETIGIVAFLADGSGPTLETGTPFVDLRITNVSFNPTISATHFNVTVQNFMSSIMYNVTLDITEISVAVEDTLKLNITETTPPLPKPLNPGDSLNFTCRWDWTNYQKRNVTVVVHTSQGYFSQSRKVVTPESIVFGITDVLFNMANMTCFNVTVQNFEASPSSSYVNITKFSLVMENDTAREISEVYPPLTPPPALYQNDSVTFLCSWNWTEYLGKNVTVVVNTLQNYTASYNETTAVPITITDAVFNLNYTSYFNITVQNSEFSPTSVNITKITVTMENATVKEINGTLVNPPLLPHPYSLDTGENETFVCPWNWKYYQGENVRITVYTLEDYKARYSLITPVNLTLNITNIIFNPVDTSYFDVTVENSENSFVNANITKITVTVANETVEEITELIPHLPKILPVNSYATFRCSWNWTEYQGKDVTITIETPQGYTISRTCKIPSASSG